jgi:23S rRNA (guanosine2251-2'-O)-methyltransferase
MAPAGIGSRVEGVHPVRAAIEAGRVRVLYVESGRGDRGKSGDVVAGARSAGVEIRTVESIREYAETDAPQGLVADARPIPFTPLNSLFAGAAAVLVLDHLEDPRNVGAIARSALGAGMTGLVVAERRSAPITAASFKASAGALERLPVARVSSIAECVQRAKKANVWTVGLAAGQPQSLFGLELLSEPVAIFIGGEGSGLGTLVKKRLDLVVSIPMSGIESLNASVAASLACFEVRRVRSIGPSE